MRSKWEKTEICVFVCFNGFCRFLGHDSDGCAFPAQSETARDTADLFRLPRASIDYMWREKLPKTVFCNPILAVIYLTLQKCAPSQIPA